MKPFKRGALGAWVLLLASGCIDFRGDLGLLSFTASPSRPGRAWKPWDRPLAVGTQLVVGAYGNVPDGGPLPTDAGITVHAGGQRRRSVSGFPGGQ